MAGVKTALSLRDVPFEVGDLRSPMEMMDDDQRAGLVATLRDLGVLDA
jgi:4-hydroxy-tetrahydrodipicolinate synthase/2-dehydro-3-deoxy-phosphogluconate/2-dehydro-3-deoxy-6-phosphogalactonate aldolase